MPVRIGPQVQAALRPVSDGDEDMDAAVQRAESGRADLDGLIRTVADALTGGGDADLIHQATLQQFLWWRLPRAYPEEDWEGLVEAAHVLLDELGMARLAGIARSEETRKILGVWAIDDEDGAAAFRAAYGASGVEPPDTPDLAWGSYLEIDEVRALDAVERALGDALETGALVAGVPRWKAKAAAITTEVLTRPLDIPPGQTLAGMVTTERVAHWIRAARDPEHEAWRSGVANRLLNPVTARADPATAVAPVVWLLQLASAQGGAELTQSFSLARASVVEAAERFGWWDWPKAPRSEADVHQLGTVRDALTRLRLVRRRGRRLHTTAGGAELLADPAGLWSVVAAETEDGEDFTRMVAELVGLRLLRGRAEYNQLTTTILPILVAQGWPAGGGPITLNQVSSAVWKPLRWWLLLGAVDEQESTWDRETHRQVTPQAFTLTADGVQMVLAYMRSRAVAPRRRIWE